MDDAEQLIAKVRALGVDYLGQPPPRLPNEPDCDEAFERQQHLYALDEFILGAKAMDERLDEMDAWEQLTRLPTDAELVAFRKRLYQVVLSGNWGDTGDELEALFFEMNPGLRR